MALGKIEGTVLKRRDYDGHYIVDVQIHISTLPTLPDGVATLSSPFEDERKWRPEVGDECVVLIGGQGESNEVLPANNSQALSIWTLYDKPNDFPTQFVMRRYMVHKGFDYPTGEAYGSEDIEVLREVMRNEGNVCISRSPEDDPKVIESWM